MLTWTRMAVLGLAVAGGAGLTGWWLSPDSDPAPIGQDVRGTVRIEQTALSAGGSAIGLSPGVTKLVQVSVSNSGDSTVRLMRVTGTASDASASCPVAGNLEMKGYDAAAADAPKYVIPAGESVRVSMSVTMLESGRNQDACKAADFPITYRLTAEEV